MLTTIILAISLAIALTPHGRADDAALYATVCTRNATPLVSAELLCAVMYVESKGDVRAVNAGGHCGAWQQHPCWSQMWGDDCADGCRQPGGEGVTCEELVDVTIAARVASRHLTYLFARHGRDRGLCRYAGATGARCDTYLAAVRRAERAL